jgi:hypothetical protein
MFISMKLAHTMRLPFMGQFLSSSCIVVRLFISEPVVMITFHPWALRYDPHMACYWAIHLSPPFQPFEINCFKTEWSGQRFESCVVGVLMLDFRFCILCQQFLGRGHSRYEASLHLVKLNHVMSTTLTCWNQCLISWLLVKIA